MAEFIRIILTMSLTGSAIALLLFGLKPFVRHRLPKYVQYYLWLVVIAVLLVPISRFITLPGNQTAVTAMPSIAETVSQFVITQAEETQRLESLAPSASHSAYQLEGHAAQSPMSLITTYFVLLYPFGVLILLLYYAIHYTIFMGLYRRRNVPTGHGVAEMLASMCRGRPPRVYYNALAQTPMLFGIFRPAIILPCQDYTRAQMQAILSHELMHLRRKDVLVKWLSLLTTALHFFNPLVWLVRKEIDRTCELSCDEAVTGGMDGHGLRHYGNTLILVAANPKTPRAIASATMSEDKKNLKERLGAIMKRRKHARYVVILSTMLVLATIGLAACLGAGREESPSNVIEADEYSYYYEYSGISEYQDSEDTPDNTPAMELELLMAPADAALLGTFASYHEIDFRDAYIAHWGVDLDWLTFENSAVIWANQPLQDFQLIGLYLGHSDYGITAHATHAYYGVAVLNMPLVINWFFTAGLFPNNGISFIDNNGRQRFFAIWAGYGHEDSEPFRLTEFVDGGYLIIREALDESEEPSESSAANPNNFYHTPVLINSSFDITIPLMEHSELVLIGILDFEPGDVYRLELNFAGGSGAFVGVTNTPYAADASRWRPLVAGSGSSMQVTHYGHGYRYLFVGSSAPLDNHDPDIVFTDVLVSLRVITD